MPIIVPATGICTCGATAADREVTLCYVADCPDARCARWAADARRTTLTPRAKPNGATSAPARG